MSQEKKPINIDYFVSIQWMCFRNVWVPREILFVPTFWGRQTIIVRNEKDSLVGCSYDDMAKSNLFFPINDFYKKDEDQRNIHETGIDDMVPFLSNEIFDKLNDKKGDWSENPLVLVANDFATFMYLEPIMPCTVVLDDTCRPENAFALEQKHKAGTQWHEIND